VTNLRSERLTGGVPHLGRWWWIPSTAVILGLLVLLIVPAAIDHRLAALRESVTTGEHARTALNDFEASFATELLVRNGSPGRVELPRATEANLDADLIDLRSALRQIDGGGIAHADSLNRLLDVWRSSLDRGDGVSADHGLSLIASAEKLDTALTHYVVSQRQAATALSRYFVAIPAVLAPIAVIAMILSMWSARQLRRFAEIADAERAQVVRAGESRAALLRGVTHDVKNPLGAANGYAQILEDGIVGPLQPAQTEMIRRIRHLLGVSITTVADLLELARADGTLHLEYATADLMVIMHEIVDDHRGMARERDITLDAAGHATPIVTDPVRVRQILANLMSNAIKYAPRGGHVRATIARGNNRVGVAVEDDGPGIPHELESKLFEEFFRVQGATNDAGNGLGLAISRRIGRLLGGDVTYSRREGGGSVFTAWFPESGNNT
jgi:signal transduction histidine kinase